MITGPEATLPAEQTTRRRRRKARTTRPPPCPRCACPRCWWDGERGVHVVDVGVGDDGGGSRRSVAMRDRAKCIACRVSFTVYEQGHYPRRQYQLDVVAVAVAAVAIGQQPARAAAGVASASATSVRRWTAWVAGLVEPSDVLAATRTLDPDAPAGAGLSAGEGTSPLRSRAARVLAVLEALGAALVRRGVALVARTGLGRVLAWQHRLHGEVVGLVAEPRHLSPAMAIGIAAGST